MKEKIKYTKGEIDKVEVINDFLPPPQNLVLKDDSVKITISLTKESVNFFKHEASRQHTSYQKMIRSLLDKYADLHSTHNKV